MKGGAAVARDKYDSFLTTAFGGQPAGFVADRGSETRWGGVVGVGGEYAFSPNWSLALEYDHLFMGSRDVAMVYDPALFVPALLNHSERIRQDVDMVTLRLNYRFGGPVIAKCAKSTVQILMTRERDRAGSGAGRRHRLKFA